MMDMKLIALGALLALTACASAVQPRDQRIQFTAVNGENAKCTLSTPLYKRHVYPPQAVQVERSKYTLVVDCTADHGKHERLLIQPESNPTSTYFFPPTNVVDRVTGSAWNYPPYIEIDFDWGPFDTPPLQYSQPPETAKGRHMITPDEYYDGRGYNK